MRRKKQPKVRKLDDLMMTKKKKKKKSFKMEESYTMVKQMNAVKNYVEMANNIVIGEVQETFGDTGESSHCLAT